MLQQTLAAGALYLSAAQAFATLAMSIDRLDPGDGISFPTPGSGIVCVDVTVDVSSNDPWSSGGMFGRALNGATLRYALDPNSGSPALVNPGLADRFVTFVSRPRGRDADDRYANGGSGIGGDFGTAANPRATPDVISVSYFASPPPTIGSPGVDGAVFRVALNIPNGRENFVEALPLTQVPPDALIYFTTGSSLGFPGMLESSFQSPAGVGSSRVDLQACKLEYSIVSPK